MIGRVETFATVEALGAFHALDELKHIRAVVSVALAKSIDDHLHFPIELQRALEASTPSDNAPLFTFAAAHARSEVFTIARQWLSALKGRVDDDRAVLDVAGDRFILSNEARAAASITRRSEPEPPSDRRETLHDLLMKWHSSYQPPWGEAGDDVDNLLNARDYQDPLDWLEQFAERAFVVWDEHGHPRLRD